MKKVTLKITGGRNDRIAQFYNCGKVGDALYEKAQALLDESDSSAIGDFIAESFPDGPEVETFVHGLEDGNIYVGVADEDGNMVFENEYFGGATTEGFVLADPRKWEFDSSLGDALTNRIKDFISASEGDIEAAVSQWGNK